VTAGGTESFDARAWVRAAGEGDASRVASLLDAGADVNAALESGETALIRAASQGRLEVVRLLLAAGADLTAEREDGFTALGSAVFFGHTEIVRTLLAGGAGHVAKGRLGARIEQWALFSGYTEITELLRGHKPSGARSPAREAPALFPSEGEFSPVVPLSELDERRGGRQREPGEQEVATIVRPRVGPSPATRPLRADRPRLPPQGWPLTLLLLGLSLIAGVLAGNYLLNSRWASSSSEPTEPAPQAAAATSEAQPPPLEAPPSAPHRPASPPESAEAKPEAERTNAAEPSTRTTKPAAVRAARPVSTPAEEKAERSRPARPAANPRPQSAGARLSKANARAVAPPPVVSSAPSDKSGKRKVIPWP
jgi:hypothetical protein